MKIKFIAPLAVLAVVGFFTACNPDRLEIPQKGVVNTDTFYKTDEDAEAALVAVYQGYLWNVTAHGSGTIYIPYTVLFNICGDDITAAGGYYTDNDFAAALNEFRYDTANQVVNDMYRGLFYGLYYANLVTDKFKYGDSDIKDRVISEARVMRAHMYLMLALGWGTPPFVDHVLPGDAYPYNSNTDPNYQMSQKDILLWCAKECEESLPYLDKRNGPGDKNGAVKATSGFANALAGKAYLFAGEYADAARCLKAVIDSGDYELVPADRWYDNFHIAGDCNEEKVFETNLEANTNLGFWDYANRNGWMQVNFWNWRDDRFVADVVKVHSSVAGWGGLGVPLKFAEEFVEYHNSDSERLNKSIINIEDLVYDTQYAEPNTDLNSMSREEKAKSTRVGITNLGLYGQSFYLPYKTIAIPEDLRNAGEACALNNFVVMRYAEVILMYAEACVQTGQAANALPYFQAIQDRAGVKDEYKVKSASDLTLDAVKKEKKFELWLEHCRWFDMVRWGDTKEVENFGNAVPELFDKLTRTPEAGEDVIWQYGSESNSRFYVIEGHNAKDEGATVGFKSGKHELFPFPYSVVNVNPNITQNPGW